MAEKKLKLNQLIGISKGLKTNKQKFLSSLYKKIQKHNLFEGRTRRYKPFDDNAGPEDTLPDEDQHIQYSVSDGLKELREICEKLYNINAAQDEANCHARADIVVDDIVLVESVPTSTLMFFDKQLTDHKTFVENLLELDPAERWEWDEQSDCFRSESKQSHRTRKVHQSRVMVEATEDHPAQVDSWTEDLPVGTWETIRLSSAMRKTEKKVLLEKIAKVQTAVTKALEEANLYETESKKSGTKILDFIYADK